MADRLHLIAVPAAVVVADTLTKVFLTTPPQLHHDRPFWMAVLADLALLLALRVAIREPRFRRPLTLVIAGGACNLAWILLADGGPDPFIAIRGDTFIAFNLADVSIVAGTLWAIAVAAGRPLRRRLA